MPAIKPLDKITSTWAKRAAAASPEYKDGVQNPRKDWEGETVAAATRYQEALVSSFERGAFTKGVTDAGTAKWQRRTILVGPTRYSEGVRVAEPEYRAGFSRFHAVIGATTLPPRGPTGSPENIERVRVMAAALHAEKVGG